MLSPRDGSLDEAAHRLLERGGADDARDERHLHERDAEDEHGLARAGAGDENEEEEQGREGEHDVGRPHENRVDERAAVAGDEADHDPAGVREQRGEPGQGKDASPTPEDAREDVATQEVGAERRSFGRPGERHADRLVGRVRGEERAEERHPDHCREQHAPDQSRRCPNEPEPGDVHACVLSFGTRRTTRRSATMLIRM